MPSNQGRDLDRLLDDVDLGDLQDASRITWKETRHHPSNATCECPLVEGLARLYELGYSLTKRPAPLNDRPFRCWFVPTVS